MGETELNRTKGLTSELKMLKSVKDPVKKFIMLSEIMEQHGKLPPKMTEALRSLLAGDTKAIGKLCKILSKDQTSIIGEVQCTALPEESNDTAVGDIVEYLDLIIKIVIAIVEEVIHE